jgi:CHAT domain-containing protein
MPHFPRKIDKPRVAAGCARLALGLCALLSGAGCENPATAPAVAAGAPGFHGGEAVPASGSQIVEAHPTGSAPTRLTPAFEQAAAAYRIGDFRAAISLWEQEVAAAEKSGDISRQCEAQLALGAAYQRTGQYDPAIHALSAVGNLVNPDDARAARALISLGAAYTYTRAFAQAEVVLNRAVQLTEAAGNAMHADALTNRAVLRGAWAAVLRRKAELSSLDEIANRRLADEKADQAMADFEQSAVVALRRGDVRRAARAAANAATSAVRVHRADAAESWNRRAAASVADLPSGLEKANLLLTIVATDLKLLGENAGGRDERLARDEKMGLAALDASQQAGDRRFESYALGQLGRIDELRGHLDRAVAWTRRAVFRAQETAAAESLYRWLWQQGRLFHRAGQDDQAIQSYMAAVESLRPIRLDLAAGLGDAGASYRDTVGPLYFELIDLLFHKASALPDAQAQALYLQIRNTLSVLSEAEIDDYFKTQCIPPSVKERSIDGTDPLAASIYIIPLPDRTEVLISAGTQPGLQRVTLAIDRDHLSRELRHFRQALETRTTRRYLNDASHLYDELFRPIEERNLLAGMATLVIVPDGDLLSVPLGALYDGKKYLIEKYAIAISPRGKIGTYFEAAPGPPQVLAAGLAQPRSVGGVDYAALDSVPREMANLHDRFGGVELVGSNFTANALTEEFRARPWNIIHLATHAQFRDDLNNTFILTSNGEMTSDGLQRLLLPAKFNGQPVQLLTLSACETAAGDDYHAALGLAGIGIKCGARSCLASLWAVNDLASAELMSQFYAGLASGLSKPQALRQAQGELLKNPRYSHACYWAPYLLIGDWK